ncbi:phosphonate metabolism transcriptional regulator PhnF [Sinorhizobium sp. 8-89]|uniref:phosphonate metabolism transcriptional regulator PhnF n=1 Tax=Sinorhizobium sp. 7-81 TaxID=3049087 RepID=UPI0024C32A44|nr:phosphonate metabolism transcriptional regulator PhnF [Sinorhizobium sp. 7-81]MDK1389495.1 phosphonate metabolism transcriptional regulator PhnF [Sinorhizobium sp. 7-81]
MTKSHTESGLNEIQNGKVEANEEAREDGSSTSLWRQIETTLKDWISSDRYPPGSQLPPDRQIAEIVGANRLTVRRALSSLAQQGVLRIEHGVGTFVERRIQYNFGERVRFNKNLKANSFAPSRKIGGIKIIEADERIAEKLEIDVGMAVIRVEIVGHASNVPIGVGSKYFPYLRFPNLMPVFEKTQSFSEAFRHFGVEDYVRKYTNVIGRMPTPAEARALRQSNISVVLAYESVDVDLEGRPISYQEGCFSGDRVMFSMENDMP